MTADRLKLLPDYDCFPTWVVGPNGDLDNVDPATLGLSDDLVADLAVWSAAYDATLKRNDPTGSGFSSERERELFGALGRSLAHRLAAEFGSVEYFDESTGKTTVISSGAAAEREPLELMACRVCGLLQPDPPWGETGTDPTFDICSCCETEFGYEDTIVEAAVAARNRWFAAGMQWRYPKDRPEDWDVLQQLHQIPSEFRQTG